ncbi:LamG domain-containing protein [Candidatus Poribacteria bacterium]
MKMMVIFLCLIPVALMLFAVQSHAIDKRSLAGVWLFDEGSGNTVGDMSGNSNDGELKGNPEWSEGQFGKALDFNGSSDYVEVPHSDSLSITGDITIVAWTFKRSDAIHGGTIVGKWKQNGDVWSYVLYGLGDNGGGWRLRWNDASQTNLEGPYQLPNDEWIHYAATYDGSTMVVYENAKEIVNIAADKEIAVTDNPVWIGNDGYQQHLNGLLDEVAIFSATLTVDEIADIMMRGLTTVLAVDPIGKSAVTWGQIKISK